MDLAMNFAPAPMKRPPVRHVKAGAPAPDFAPRRFAHLNDEMPCSPVEDFFMTWGSISALVLTVVIVVAFAVGG